MNNQSIKHPEQSKPKTLSNVELLEIFPEGKSIIPKLLKLYKQQRTELVEVIAERLKAIKTESSDEMYLFLAQVASRNARVKTFKL